MLIRFLIIFLFLNFTLNAEECSVCKKKITGDYIKSSSGAIFCSKKCSESILPNCDLCGGKSKQYITVAGKNYCSRECAAKAGPHCSVCNKALFGTQFLTGEKAVYCNQDCFLKTVKACVLCGGKSMDMSKVAGKDYCGKCVKLEKCEACGLPSNGGLLEDGREICKSCRQVGVQDSAKAKEIYLNVKEILTSKYKLETTIDLPFSLIDKTEFVKIKGFSSPIERGFYRQKESQHYIKSKDATGKVISEEKTNLTIDDRHIFILSYLPENSFRNVVAHELTHNWHMLNYPQIEDKKIEEGLSEYVAYLLNIAEGDTDLAQRKIENKDPVYGDGFRLVKEWDKGKGIDDIKAKLKELYGAPKK